MKKLGLKSFNEKLFFFKKKRLKKKEFNMIKFDNGHFDRSFLVVVE